MLEVQVCDSKTRGGAGQSLEAPRCVESLRRARSARRAVRRQDWRISSIIGRFRQYPALGPFPAPAHSERMNSAAHSEDGQQRRSDGLEMQTGLFGSSFISDR